MFQKKSSAVGATSEYVAPDGGLEIVLGLASTKMLRLTALGDEVGVAMSGRGRAGLVNRLQA